MAGESKLLTLDDVEKMFELHYQHKLTKAEVAKTFDLDWRYCHRILIAERLKKWTKPLFEKYAETEACEG